MIILTNLALMAAITSWVFAAFYFAATVAMFHAVITTSGRRITTKTILWRIFYSALATYTGLYLYHVHLELGGWA